VEKQAVNYFLFKRKGNQSMPAQQQGQRTPKTADRSAKFETVIFKSIDFDVR
jgi:hypothetical protein